MYNLRRPLERTIILTAERFLAILLLIAVYLRMQGIPVRLDMEGVLSQRISVLHILVIAGYLAVWVACFSPRAGSRAQVLAWAGMATSVRGLVVVNALIAAIAAGAKGLGGLYAAFPLFLFFSAGLVAVRCGLLWYLERGPRKVRLNAVILGTGQLARRAWREIRTEHYGSIVVLGFVDDHCLPTCLPEIRANYLGTITSLSDMFLRQSVDLMIIALPAKSCYAEIQKAIHIAENVGVNILQLESVFSLKRRTNGTVTSQAGMYLINERGRPVEQALKRLLDILVSALGLLAISPVLLGIAIAVKVSSPGPALFSQERYGLRRRKFKLFKFRTMVVNAEQLLRDLEAHNEAVGPIFKMKRDPRVTRIGRILRATSLDELPQLWNVLKGDMSLVGPRPMSIRDVSLFDDAYLMRRFQVKPGITGLWQVSGRSNTTFDHWMAMDFRYIDQWSLWLDFEILFRTIPAVLKGSGAY